LDCYCGQAGAFGYRNHAGDLVWYCNEHRLAEHWADARRAIEKTIPDTTSATTPVAPDLQELVARFGGYDNITAEAWAQFDADMAAYLSWLRRRR
jgi:hypothetical protein